MLKEIRDRVEECIVKAENHFGETIPRPKILFNLKGCTAGISHYSKGHVRFNVQLAKRNEEDFFYQTVPHEIAHWVQRWKYGYNGVKAHGREWKSIMISVYKLSPKRCHRYDTTETQVRKCRRYTYHCRCREHELTSIRHNKIRRGRTTYHCNRCGAKLEYAGAKRKPLTPEVL